MQNWLNRAGLILQFLALFLVTPEIFGEDRVRAATTKYVVGPLVRTVAFFRRHPVIRTFGYVVLAFGLLCLWIAAHVGINGSFILVLDDESFAGLLLILLVVGVIPYVLWRFAKLLAHTISRLIDKAATEHRSFLPVGASFFVVGFLLLMAATFVRPSS